MQLSLTLDSIALLLYCSELYFNEERPMNEKEWEYLEKKVKHSEIKTPAGLLGLDYSSIIELLDIEDDFAKRLAQMNTKLADLMVQLAKIESYDIGIVTKYEERFPLQLREKMKKDYPMILYYIGNFELLKTPSIYITGPIKTNTIINKNTRKITEKLQDENYTLITSHSRGTESLAVNTQLKNGGKVVEFSCENMLESKKRHAKAIKNGQMLIISARHPFATFDLIRAIDRNQYIYCLSKAALVVYSSINAGAAWLSAIQNINNKYTKLAAIVDDEFYGNAKLIELGAYPITMEMIDSDISLEDMLEEKEEVIARPTYFDQLSIFEFLS